MPTNRVGFVLAIGGLCRFILRGTLADGRPWMSFEPAGKGEANGVRLAPVGGINSLTDTPRQDCFSLGDKMSAECNN